MRVATFLLELLFFFWFSKNNEQILHSFGFDSGSEWMLATDFNTCISSVEVFYFNWVGLGVSKWTEELTLVVARDLWMFVFVLKRAGLKIYILLNWPQVNQVVSSLTFAKPMTYSWFERTHSHNGNNKGPSSRGMLQWGILDTIRKNDLVMLLIWWRHSP